MSLRRAVAIAPILAAILLPAAASPAAAQFQPQPQPQQQPPPCMQEFLKLRADAEKKAAAIKLASEHKATPKEACHLFTVFAAAEVKLIKFAAESGVWCGMPDQVLAQMQQSHAQTDKLRVRICQAAAAPPRPAGPTLSDSLAAPVPDASNIKTGKGTYDTLTGAPIGK
jgi:hypothetical protein